MKAVILAAGKGTRMLPLTQTHTASMLSVGNIPLLAHIIMNIKDAGINEIIIVTNDSNDSIYKHFKNGTECGLSIKYVIQKSQLGTAHAIDHAQLYINEDERFLVIGSDTIVPTAEIKHMMNMDGNTIVGTMIVERDQCEYGVIELNGEYVSKIIEKPTFTQSYMVNAGIYIFDPTIFQSISLTEKSARNEFEITDSIQLLIDNGEKIRYTIFQKIHHISRPWDLLDCNQEYMSTLPDCKIIPGELESNIHLKGPIFIEKGTKIRSGTYIEGPVIIGSNCDIGPNCFIRPYTCIGNHVSIGSATEIKGSIIMDWTHVGHFTYIGDSIIGVNCNFGAGTQVANLRHDNTNIKVKIDGKIVDSGRRKLGTIMGDNVHTGINSMLNVGSTIESNSNILPGELVMSDHKSERYTKKEVE